MTTGDPQELAINIMNAVMGLLVLAPALYVLGAILFGSIRSEPAGTRQKATKALPVAPAVTAFRPGAAAAQR